MKLNRLIISIFIPFGLTCLSSVALAQLDTVIGGVAHANGAMFANPPLPILFNKKGAFKVSLQPGYFKVDASAEGDIKELDYSGYGLSAIYNQLLSERIGYFILASATKVGGEIRAPGANSSGQIVSSGIDSTLFMASAGLTYTLFNSNWLSIPVFAGPAFFTGSFSSSFLHTNSSNTILDDFDAKTNPSLTGFMAGVQAGIHLSKHFSLNPYFVVMQPFGNENSCQKFTATNVRVSGGLFDQSSPACLSAANSGGSLVNFDVFVQSFGLNLIFPTIGLSVNAYAESGDVPLFQGTKIRLFLLSFSFGTT